MKRIPLIALLFLLPRLALADMSPSQADWLYRLSSKFSLLLNTPVIQNNECRDLKDGEIRYPTTTKKYGVKKISDKLYELEFNVEYVPHQIGITRADAEEFRNKVKSCFKNFGALQDPFQNKITLSLTPDHLIKSTPIQKTTISLFRDDNERSSISSYDISINCQTIIHETLHIAGLWDEYKEPARDYSCRTVPDSNSIMAEQDSYETRPSGLALAHYDFNAAQIAEELKNVNSLESEKFITPVRVSCSNDNDGGFLSIYIRGSDLINTGRLRWQDSHQSYTEKTQKMSLLSLVSNTKQDEAHTKLDTKFIFDRFLLGQFKSAIQNTQNWHCEAYGAFSKKTKAELLKSGKAAALSVFPLKPAHIRKLIYPNCIEKNKFYDLCTADAYKSRKNVKSCNKDKYQICSSGNYLF